MVTKVILDILFSGTGGPTGRLSGFFMVRHEDGMMRRALVSPSTLYERSLSLCMGLLC
jgi:hypothetical protein